MKFLCTLGINLKEGARYCKVGSVELLATGKCEEQCGPWFIQARFNKNFLLEQS